MILFNHMFVRRILIFSAVLVIASVFAAAKLARITRAIVVTPAPAWQVTDVATPSVMPAVAGKIGRYDAVIENVGGAATEGEFKIKIHIPAGLSVINLNSEPEAFGCEEEPEGFSCTYGEPVVPSGFIVVQALFEVTGTITSIDSSASVSGGGAGTASDKARMRLGGEHEKAPAGIAAFRFDPTDAAGKLVTQAGGHPNLLTTTLLMNNMFIEGVNEASKPIESPKDVVFYLPLGMLGNPTVTQSCPASIIETTFERTGCPSSSRVGSVLPMILSTIFANTPDPTHVHGIYSVTPEKGYAAQFAFTSNHLTFNIYASVVRHDGAYMLRVGIPGTPALSALVGFVATFYGDIQEKFVSGESEGTFDRGAFLTNPMDCAVASGQAEARAREASVVVNTWQHPYHLGEAEDVPGDSLSTAAFAGLQGCEALAFSPGITVEPETTQADEPSGYEVGIKVPQAPNDPRGLATPPVRDVSITLPEGTSISPSSANGLQACQESGAEGINIEGPESEEMAADGLERPARGHCPIGSRIASVTANTPLLHEQLNGHMFLAAPECGGAGQPACSEEDAENGRLFRLFLELDGPESGVVVKLKGTASVDPQSGRITATFTEGPQFPFSNLMVTLKHGARAPVANSQACGTAASVGIITPWSSQTPVMPSDRFNVDWNGSGGDCPATLPFAPSFAATTTSPTAAATSPFALELKREDREQNIESLSTTLPEGLLADVAKVTKCPEPQASQASLTACPANSQIGTTSVAVGSGSDPYNVTGKVFFTGPYGGAPFGLSVVVPAVAGPFNLGNVLVRVALFVDPHTAQATAVSGPLPQKLDGVPLRLRTIQVMLENREFVLNPTSCSAMSITGAIHSTTGATANVSSPFAASGCRNLGFKPLLTGSTEKKATKANGTGVHLKIAYPSGGPAQANIAKVVLAFPKQLPVRLETLQKACRAATFEANPAACPAASNIGTAIVHTPILAQPLTGPAYLVSYGSAKFPDVVFVLQGEGITLDVDGQSFVSHTGELRVTFASVPDAPFSTFESVLPAGPYSQFTSSRTSGRAQASQCGENLVAPVTMTAYNGAQVTQKAKLKIAGCGPTVSIGKVHATAHSLTVSVSTSARGRLRIGGTGLKTLTRSNLGAGTHKLTVSLTAGGRAAAHAHSKIRLTAGLTAGKQKASAHKSVRL